MLDQKVFAQNMAGLCQIYDGEATRLLLDLYYEVLKDLTNDQFLSAIRHILNTRKWHKLPLPAEIHDAALGDVTTRAVLAWERFEKALLTHHSWCSFVFEDRVIHSVVEALGGLIKVSETKDDEWKWLRKEFIALYPIHLANPRDSSERLIGRLELENQGSGYAHKIRVAYIGSAKDEVRMVDVAYSDTKMIPRWDETILGLVRTEPLRIEHAPEG